MSSLTPDISLVVPVYNERDNLAALFEEIQSALAPSGRSFEVIAVDDGSTDGSPDILRQLVRQYDFLKVVFFRKNCGQTAAFDAGFRHISGQIVVTLDSDRQNDPHDILRLIGKLDEGYDYVAGWRRRRKDPFLLRRLPSLTANWVIRRVTGTKIHDLGCSLKVFRREITDELRLYGEMHRFIGPLAEAIGARVAEVEVNHRSRVAGVSKYGLARTFKVLLDTLTVWFLTSYQAKPIYVFGGTALGSFVVSFGLVAVVAYEKLCLGVWVHKSPRFLLAIMFALMGVQFLGMGLLAEMLARTYFEARGRLPYSVREVIGCTQRDDP
jgi:glycosyltransferase involved in cell wall biosynthesis